MTTRTPAAMVAIIPVSTMSREIHAKHVAEQNVIEMHVALDLDVEHQPEPEHAREHDPHHRVLLDAAVLLEEAGRQRADHAGRESADCIGKSDNVGDHDAGKNGMRDRVAHQRPALEDEEAGEECGRDRDQYRDDQRVAHELELEGLEERVEQRHGPASSAWIARRRAASMPCLGARKKTARKVSVCRTTMIPPVAPSRK